MIRTILIGAAFGAECLFCTSQAMAGADYPSATAQEYRDPFQANLSNNTYDANPAFTQGCPAGSIPESFPNGNGRRCALPGGGYSY